MALFLRIFLLSTSAFILTRAEESLEYRTCHVKRMDPNSALGQCIPRDECEEGKFEISASTPPLNKRDVIVCASHLECCIPQNKSTSLPQQCGWIQQGIGDAVPGLAKRGEIPWSVGIFRPVERFNRVHHKMRFLANGVLIHQQAVLTVAKKAKMFNFKGMVTSGLYVAVGDYKQNLKNQRRRALRVKNVILHEYYVEDRSENNFALVILHNPVHAYLPSAVPICLPTSRAEVPTGTGCFFTGWGKDSDNRHQAVLTKTFARIFDRNDCANRLRSRLGTYYEVQPSLICAGGQGSDYDMCKGGGGTPLFCPVEGQPNRYQLVGLVAYVAECGPLGIPAVFANVASARVWILYYLEKQGLDVSSLQM